MATAAAPADSSKPGRAIITQPAIKEHYGEPLPDRAYLGDNSHVFF